MAPAPPSPSGFNAGTAPANGLELAYETIGDPGDPTVLLIMGLGAQLIAWPDELCSELAAAGHHVVRFDNRDVGLSTHLHHLGAPTSSQILRHRGHPPYRLADMADDAMGLLDHLGVDQAHVVGASMGGFIAQTVALAHPERVRSLTVFMTSTGSLRVGMPAPHILARLARRRPALGRAEAIEAAVETFRQVGSPGYPFDAERLRQLAARGYDRAYDPGGFQRQAAAIAAQPDRTAALARLRMPTVVLHGLADPLINDSGGRAVARAVPGARFVGFSGMGHDLPQALWPHFLAEMTAAVAAGEAAAA